MNVCIDFLNSLPNILNLQQLLIPYVHNSYFVVYPVKMIDTTFEYRGHIQCVQKIAIVQKSMYHPSYIVQRM